MLSLTRADWVTILQGVAFLLLCLDIAHRAHCAYRDSQLTEAKLRAKMQKRLDAMAQRRRNV